MDKLAPKDAPPTVKTVDNVSPITMEINGQLKDPIAEDGMARSSGD